MFLEGASHCEEYMLADQHVLHRRLTLHAG